LQLGISVAFTASYQWLIGADGSLGGDPFAESTASIAFNILVYDNATGAEVLDESYPVWNGSSFGLWEHTTGSDTVASRGFGGAVDMTAGHQYSVWFWVE